MVFSSPLFVFLFLPVVLSLYFLVRRELKNILLLVASIFFYFWGEHTYVAIMLSSIITNHLLGLSLGCSRNRKRIVVFSVILNLGLLGAFKYLNFIISNINFILTTFQIHPIQNTPVHLPIGISFFTFQALSYIIDVYREEVDIQRNPVNTALYISFFPQLIAGPIVRYHDISAQLKKRVITPESFSNGIKRFVVGLGKKMLIANTVASCADSIFSLPADQLTSSLAWLGAVCYTLQIYFDFSGYSDMAIGLGLMFGFNFLENFNYPYISKTVQDFWRKWHISLTNWFRDYLYIPLGGNKCSPLRVYFNLITVFFLTGLWHGANWTFIFWGLYHGTFLIIERIGFNKIIRSVWPPFQHIYVLLVVIIGWVFFRSESLGQAYNFILAMFGAGSGQAVAHHTSMYLNPQLVTALTFGVIFSCPLKIQAETFINEKASQLPSKMFMAFKQAYHLLWMMSIIAILVLASMQLAAQTYNPFIYFRF